MRELNPSVEFANKTGLVYSAVCKPLCQKLHLPQTAFDILMFLANNPNYTTARDIVEVRHIKANLVSELACTEKAQSIIEQGRRMQDDFIRRLMAGLEEEKLEIFFEVIDTMNENLDAILEGEE